jgi:hypothetical protein
VARLLCPSLVEDKAIVMSPLTTSNKVAIWVAVIGAVGLAIAALIPGVIPWISDGRSKKYISGAVFDAGSKAPMSGVVIRLQTNEGKQLAQDTSDRDGNFSLAIPDGPTVIRLAASASGYVPYDKKLPVQETKQDIPLVRQPITFGIPDGTSLDSAIQIVAGKLNVTIVFSKKCSKRATIAAVNGGEVEGDPKLSDAILKDLVDRVRDNSLRYDIITIEVGKRYEVRCF